MAAGHIYLITNTVNGKQYVGQTIKEVSVRWDEHIYASKKNSTYPLHHAIRKYGVDKFRVDTIDYADTLEELSNKEIMHIKARNLNIKKSNNGYNQTDGGESITGYKFSHEQKAKLSNSKRGKLKLSSRKEISNNVSQLWKTNEYRDKLTTHCPLTKEELEPYSVQAWDFIADEFNVSVGTVKKWFKGFKLKKEPTHCASRKPWSKEEELELIVLFDDGLICRDIAKRLERTTTSVRKKLQALRNKGLITYEACNPRHKKWNLKDAQIALDMWKKGFLLEEIAEKLNRTSSSVANKIGRIL